MLANPLSKAQLEAADDLYMNSLSGWRAADGALAELKDRFPEFGQTSVLLKAVAVNTLYGTNVLAIQKMAEHAVSVLSNADLSTAGPELVEEVGNLDKRRHISFGSKFLHFFLDRERFPIFDKYATEMVENHLGRANSVRNHKHPYMAFFENFHKLKTLSGIECNSQELDRYLWLAGQLNAFKRDPETEINRETRDLFSEPTEGQKQLLGALVP